jgi:predicted metal-dependent phosphoesterase TrpH
MKIKSKQKNLQKADLHIHTNVHDGLSAPEEVVLKAVEKKVRFIAITDHNTILGALAARRYAQENRLNVEVIIGEEILTKDGEILALFIKEKIPPYREIDWTCKQIHKQGGLAIAPHPFRRYIGWGISEALFKDLWKKNLLDGAEMYNPWDFLPFIWQKRKRIFQQTGVKSLLANSDAHYADWIGAYYNETFADNIDELKQEIIKAKTRPILRKSRIKIWARGFCLIVLRIIDGFVCKVFARGSKR